MNRKERRAIEARLPRRFRGHAGYGRLLRSLSLRISVSGIRGKSGLTHMAAEALEARRFVVYAKQTGTEPVSTKNGIPHPIRRDPRRKAVLAETQWEVKRYWPMEVAVMENQGISEYTMRAFNQLYCRPHYLLVTNVRRDHQGDLARTLPDMARAFVRSATRECTIVSGETDPEIQHLMKEEARRLGVRFLAAAPGPRTVPGLESITILDAMLWDWMGSGLRPTEFDAHVASLEAHFRWRASALPGVQWFHGAEINDVDSTRAVLMHLLRGRRLPVTFVAYFRPDRPDRTASFVPFLQEMLAKGVAERVVVSGHRSKTVARCLQGHGGDVWHVADDQAGVASLARRLGAVCQNQAVMTVANAVPPWPRRFAQCMAEGPDSIPDLCEGATHDGRPLCSRAFGGPATVRGLPQVQGRQTATAV